MNLKDNKQNGIRFENTNRLLNEREGLTGDYNA